MTESRCLYCGNSYPADAFGVALTTEKKTYRRRKCRDCYRTTKQVLIKRYHRWLNDLKIVKGCSLCGLKDSRVLDFHHKNETTKLFTIDGFCRSVGFDRIVKEVEKCEVVCAGCHRILHDEHRSDLNGA